MRILQISVATLLLYLVALGSSQMANDTLTEMMNTATVAMEVTPSVPVDTASMGIEATTATMVNRTQAMVDTTSMGIEATTATMVNSTQVVAPAPSAEPAAEASPLLLPEWAIAFIVVGGVFLVLATIATVGMCVGIATKSR